MAVNRPGLHCAKQQALAEIALSLYYKHMPRQLTLLSSLSILQVTGGVALVVVVGVAAVYLAFAAPTTGFEVESGQNTGAKVIALPGASGGSAVQFAAPTPVVTASPNPGPTVPAAISGLGYKLAWGDDFTGATIDTSKWNIQNNSNFGSGNNEDQCYKSANATVSGGILSLTAKRETVAGCGSNPQGGSNYYWTSGMLTTRAQGGALKYAFTHGYAEARLKAPRGNAYWPAFWLVSSGQPGQPSWPAYGEFDVTELYGSYPDSTFGTLHYQAASGHVQTSPNQYNIATGQPNSNKGPLVPPLVAAAINDWHTYGLLWEPARLTWFVDGRPFQYFNGANNTMYTVAASGTATAVRSFAAPSTNFWNLAHAIHLNLAIGGSGPTYFGYTGRDSATGYVDGNLAADIPGAMQVDYVRVWQP